MPDVYLFQYLRGPWIITSPISTMIGKLSRLFDAESRPALFIPESDSAYYNLLKAAVKKLPDALRFLQEFADTAHDTRESVDGRFFCLWCGADLGHRAQTTGESDDMPDTPVCADPSCTGNAARALLRELEQIATASTASTATHAAYSERNPDDDSAHQ